LFLRENFSRGQIRQFDRNEKIKIKCQRFQTSYNYLFKNHTNFNDSRILSNKNWISLNQSLNEKPLRLESKKLVIYPYSLSSNLLKEVLVKMGFKFVLTNEIKKATLIIGLKKHLKQNFKLKSLAHQRKIPIYSLNQVSIYQVTKLVQYIFS
jgi:hypothetical protein